MTSNRPDYVGVQVERLVGPVGPELSCDECFDRLDAYVERKLVGLGAEDDMALMRAHLLGCSACRDDHDSLLALLQAGPDEA